VGWAGTGSSPPNRTRRPGCADLVDLLIAFLTVAVSLLAAASLRLRSLTSTVLAAYLALVVNAVVVTVGLSPFRLVRASPLAVAEAVVFGVVLGVWWWRGRPRPRYAATLARAGRELARSPLALLYLVVTAAALGYELLVGLTVPPNNWDSLTYHLARAAAWAQHGGYFWVPNAPTDRLNVFQPLAEQQVLFLFAASKTSRLYALPQYLAQLAVLVSVVGSARRLGFPLRSAVCCAALLATLTLVALESTTAQNDLVAASFPAVAACLLLGGSAAETALAGVALGVGLGAKLTTVFVWPALALLVWPLGGRAFLRIVAGASAGLVLAGWWGYWLNLAHGGHLLGGGFGRDVGASPPLSAGPGTVLHVLYRLFDVSTLSDRLIGGLAIAGLATGALVFVLGHRRWGRWTSLRRAGSVAIALAVPLLVLVGAAGFAAAARAVHLPVKVASESGLDRRANEDYSAFGPVGALMLLGTPALTVVLYLAGRVDRRYLALALALPVFLILMAVELAYNPFVTRFLLVPAVLTAPLFGIVLGSRAAASALLVVAAVALVWTLEYDRTKPYRSQAGHPWHMTQVQALQYVFEPAAAPADDAYERLVPPHACVGAILGPDEPSYLLWGRDRDRRVFYLPSTASLDPALAEGLYYVVISTGSNAAAAGQFRGAGWTIRPLGSYWLLATAPHARGGECS
jgi:hypothetical protein